MITKFDLEQKVWVMHNNEPTEVTVIEIAIKILDGCLIIYYFNEEEVSDRTEEQVCSTKEDLMELVFKL